MNKSTATIILKNPEALRVAASSARISTTAGTALEIFQKSDAGIKDFKLVKKVLSSGHKSVIEHQTLSIAFDNVSVLVEQFVIEFRLASFTVKSRRYVDFSDAGFVRPEGTPDGFAQRMDALFGLYDVLLAKGIPKEDARFVLPYCFRSNFYMTLNAREFVLMVRAMLYGRGKRFAEIRMLGASLRDQFELMYPGVIDAEGDQPCAQAQLPSVFNAGESKTGHAELISAPDCKWLLNEAISFSGRFSDVGALIQDVRPRELELLNFVFRIHDASLACVTHFARHRIQSPLYMHAIEALARGSYVLPKSILADAEAKALYEKAFRDQATFAKEMLEKGLPAEDIAYLALSGHTADMLLSINGRELLHFLKLRTCRRAQWEIREIALEMLNALQEKEPQLFRFYGPSCLVEGRCPEGRLSCGCPVKMQPVEGE